MNPFQNISIRKKILYSMLIFTLIPIVLVSSAAMAITYRTMKDQLIYDHRMSIGWLQDRLSLETQDMKELFYEFEVDKDVKADILQWCTTETELDYAARWRIITVMNTVMSMDNSINSIELVNLSKDASFVVERSGAYSDMVGDKLDLWKQRNTGLQTNLVYLRDGDEILACHQIYRFDDHKAIALVIVHMRPYQLQEILNGIKTVPEESILVFNDQDELIEADYGIAWDVDAAVVNSIHQQLAQGEKKEGFYDDQFWFYRGGNGGKLQVLLTIPNTTIVQALLPTMLSGILVAVVAIVSSVLCSVFYSRAVTRPIQKLSEEMKTLTLNEYSGSFSGERKDEIGILQDSFDHMISRNKELIAQQYQSKIEKRNAQLRALQAQINPHFMYNTLQVIGGMALERNAPEIYQVTIALSDIMRYSLNFSKDMVRLEEEVTYLQSYVMIQNERFGGKVQLDLRLAPETMDCLIPKLILQPLVENSFEHGLPEKAGKWIICVESSITPQKDLLLRVKDNGVGFTEKRLEEVKKAIESETVSALTSGSHIGLANVHARIRLRNNVEGYGVSIFSTPEAGTTICVRLHVIHEGGSKN